MGGLTTFSWSYLVILLLQVTNTYGLDSHHLHHRFPSHHLHRRDFHHIHRRDLPGNWSALGCWTDNVNGVRTLAAASYTDTVNMTIESCIAFCSTGSNSYVYAGVEYAQECYCDNYFASGATSASSSDCDMPCTGNAAEICGAGNRLDIFWSGVQPPSPPTMVPSVGNWSLLGCYSETDPRALPYGTAVTGSVSVESCTTACYNGGYPLAGMEYASQCYCGLTLGNGSGPTPFTDCDMVCAGNSSEFCGGSNRLSLYNYTQTLPSSSTNGGGGGDGSGGGGGGVSYVTSGLPGNWSYEGCYVDNANGRVLGNELDGANTTVESCIANCASQGSTIAGIEYSTQCFCGDYLVNGATVGQDSNCNMACGGNSTEACGGPNLLSIYSSTGNVTLIPVPVIQNTSLPGEWVYQGCLSEPQNGGRAFPYEMDWFTNNTVEACLNQCAAFGYPAAGLEYGYQCFCGDITDVAANGATYGPDSGCLIPCPGDPYHLCGGVRTLSTYYWNGTMNLWNTPENTGYYEFLIGGLIVPLIATVGINNKVTFLEKWGTSEYDNSTGAYELDISLVDNYQLAWREMHVQTDVFCSGSIVLPDLGGRIINVGGWSLESTFGVRLYTPDGSPGVNGTNDWEENVNELSLQVGRWYPTAMMMPNGSILVVGGESGSNASPQPSLEILPTIPGGSTIVTLDYLQRTDPYNLYPFLMVLPSGNFFIGYYNEARILEPVMFETVTVLPNMPGAVNDFLAGRTYPMEGTAVFLPQYAPYTDPIEILICGGSTIGAAIALDNCISITPEVENATWTIERMPSQRVMPCMVTLPDGTYMILNGAQQGVAGFGLATNPNLNALLYDPSQPVGQRLSILNNTIVDRLYHSEATLLPDGRVLVSGSDPQTYYPNGSFVYPEEMRIEVYVPPYLSQGLQQPEFDITETDWDLGGQYDITVNLFQGTTSTMRISLVAASSSTHGNVMSGGRILFPEFSCSGNTCTITAPPNAFVCPPGWHQLFILDGPTPSSSAWVRIGGDPAQLGNWPDFPDFTTPGV